MEAIIKCSEEELAPLFTWPVRRRTGWRWLPFYLRGPALPGMLGPLLTLMGIWCFSRKPARLVDVPKDEWVDARIRASCIYIGSYGMGGPGFVGLKCHGGAKRFWIVFTLWGAAGWLTLDGKLLDEGLIGDEKKTYAQRGVVSLKEVYGGTIQGMNVTADTLTLEIAQSDRTHILQLRRDGTTVPPFRGTGGKKTFGKDDRLEDAVILSKRARLWLED